MARGPRVKNVKVYRRLADDLVAVLGAWGRHGAFVVDAVDACGVYTVTSPGPVWHLEFVFYPHHRTVAAKLYARVGTRCGRFWSGQAILKSKPQAVDLLKRVGLTSEVLAQVEGALLDATGIWAGVDNRVHREITIGTRLTPKTS